MVLQQSHSLRPLSWLKWLLFLVTKGLKMIQHQPQFPCLTLQFCLAWTQWLPRSLYNGLLKKMSLGFLSFSPLFQVPLENMTQSLLDLRSLWPHKPWVLSPSLYLRPSNNKRTQQTLGSRPPFSQIPPLTSCLPYPWLYHEKAFWS